MHQVITYIPHLAQKADEAILVEWPGQPIELLS